jgi:hypothetical protein
MKRPQRRSITLIRKLVRRANRSNDKSLFSLLSLIEQKIYTHGRAHIEAAIEKATGAGGITRRQQTIHNLSRYVE